MRKFLCEECLEDVAYKVIEKQATGTVRGKKYHYMGKFAYCDECGSEVYVGKFNDYNLEALYAEFRKDKGIISLDDTREIVGKYGFDNVCLALGWDKEMLYRYCCYGDIPSKEKCDLLKKIYENPKFYSQRLEAVAKN